MRRFTATICVMSSICFAGAALAFDPIKSAFGEKCDSEVLIIEHGDYHAEARRHRRGLNQIGILRISPSRDPWLLFEEFAKRLSVVAIDRSEEDWPPRDVRSIIKTGGGDRDELAFVLLNLFAANHLETELLYIYRDPHEVGSAVGTIDRVLVYLPVIDQVVDPTLPLADQHKGSGRAFLVGKPRLFRAYPVWRSAYNCHPSAIRGYLGKRDSDAVPAATAPK